MAIHNINRRKENKAFNQAAKVLIVKCGQAKYLGGVCQDGRYTKRRDVQLKWYQRQ